MYIVPFGEVKENRFEACKNRGYVEQVAGIWRLTEKCKKKYDEVSMLKYLKEKINQPQKNNSSKTTKETLISELLQL